MDDNLNLRTVVIKYKLLVLILTTRTRIGTFLGSETNVDFREQGMVLKSGCHDGWGLQKLWFFSEDKLAIQDKIFLL